MRAIATAALASTAPSLANVLYGKLARRVAEMFGWPVDRRADGSPIWMSLIAEGWQPPDREFEWTMVPTAAAAVKTLLSSS
ncbi:hypothetical protein [Lichenihabitans psoromatis]|uniref:hypothetical protein n=1 Tax=Lichenihabitans psoromatis TaxID=2528642 RepID=UPI001035815D|nr:hypothetical protein [Lichenihabitans psoromatis]